MSIIGLAAIMLALFRWKPNDLSLISFGIFCFLFGIRYSAVIFFFGVPLWFWYYWSGSIAYILVLCGKLESDFVTAGYLYLDTEEKNVSYAGAGHPPLFLWRGSDPKIYEYRERGVILGQFEDARYQNINLELKAGDRFLLYTDGIIEATNAAGEIFGWDHFKKFISSYASLPVGQFADDLIQQVTGWSGKKSQESLDDDLTLVIADFENS